MGVGPAVTSRERVPVAVDAADATPRGEPRAETDLRDHVGLARRPAIGRRMAYRAIVFDLAGVLLDSEGAHESAARRVAGRLRLKVPEEWWSRIRGGAYEDFFWQVLSLPDNANCGMQGMQVVLHAYDAYYDEVQRCGRLLPGAVDVLELSRTAFDSVALATSSEWRLVDAALRHFGLAKYFDGIVSGDHITQKKPAPEAFLVAAWLLGVKPSNMIVIEDSTHGIRAARLARTHVIGIATTKDPQALALASAHHVVRDHRELVAHLRGLEQAGRTTRRWPQGGDLRASGVDC